MNILFTKRYAELPVLVGTTIVTEKLVQRDATWYDCQNVAVWYDAVRKCFVPMKADKPEPVKVAPVVTKKAQPIVEKVIRSFVYDEGQTKQAITAQAVYEQLTDKGQSLPYQTIIGGGKEMVGTVTIVGGKAEYLNHPLQKLYEGMWIYAPVKVTKTKMRQVRMEEVTQFAEMIWNDDKSSGVWANIVKEGEQFIAYLDKSGMNLSLTQYVVERDGSGDFVINYPMSEQRGRYSVLDFRKDGTSYVRRYR